jgi:2,4-dienoyl-CoA reductase-like NADH-dependent reductase (Old Yellow Enzyme family)
VSLGITGHHFVGAQVRGNFSTPHRRQVTMSTSALFTLVFRSVCRGNRLWVAPMCEYSVEKLMTGCRLTGTSQLADSARGGAGLVITEATAVSAEGRISPKTWASIPIEQSVMPGLWSSGSLQRTRSGAVAGIQLCSMPGRKASTRRPWLLSGEVCRRPGRFAVAPPRQWPSRAMTFPYLSIGPASTASSPTLPAAPLRVAPRCRI